MLHPASDLPTREFSAPGSVPDRQAETTEFRSGPSEANGTTTMFDPAGMFGVIGDYDLVRRLGRRVFLAHHRVTRQSFAVRVLDPAPERGAGLAQRQLADARALAMIDHPNVGRVIEVGADAGRVYVVMEYLRGTTLSSVLELHGTLSGAQAIRIGALIAKGLEAAHQRGIVHRHLEAGAVIVLPSDRGRSTLKLIDFAISESPEVVRIPRHSMSPELCSGGPVDHRTDLYSLGVLLHRVCTGRDPFEGSPIEINAMHRFRSVVRPPPVLVGIPDELSVVIQRCLCVDPAGRYRSAGEVIEALRRDTNESVRHDPPQPAGRAPAVFVDVAPAAAARRASGSGGVVAPAVMVPASAPNAMMRDDESGILIVPGNGRARIATAVQLEGGRVRSRRRPWMALLVLGVAMAGGSALALSTMDSGGGAPEVEQAASAEPSASASPAPAPAPAASVPAAPASEDLVPDAVSAPDALPPEAARAATRAAAEAQDPPPRKPRAKRRRPAADDDGAVIIISDDKPRNRRDRSNRIDL